MSEPLSISYQGNTQSYSYTAATDYFPGASLRSYRTFMAAVQAVKEGDADAAVIPVENSTAGRVTEVYNILPESGLSIMGEYLLPIKHSLMVPMRAFRSVPPAGLEGDALLAWKNSPLSEDEKQKAMAGIKEVHSHPQALAQCRKYLHAKLPKADPVEVGDTAGAARDLTLRETADIAAIASRRAADFYHMAVLDDDIADVSDNMTRFLILSKTPREAGAVAGPALTTILFETQHKPGALLGVLQVFQKHGIDLTKLETYMSTATRPNPTFYVDVAANLNAPNMKAAMDEFTEHAQNITVMGCYPASPLRGQGNNFLPVTV